MESFSSEVVYLSLVTTGEALKETPNILTAKMMKQISCLYD